MQHLWHGLYQVRKKALESAPFKVRCVAESRLPALDVVFLVDDRLSVAHPRDADTQDIAGRAGPADERDVDQIVVIGIDDESVETGAGGADSPRIVERAAVKSVVLEAALRCPGDPAFEVPLIPRVFDNRSFFRTEYVEELLVGLFGPNREVVAGQGDARDIRIMVVLRLEAFDGLDRLGDVVPGLYPAGVFKYADDRWDEKRHQDADDGDNGEKFDEREGWLAGAE